jgi:hypothetical protein
MGSDLHVFRNDYYTLVALDMADAVAVVRESGSDGTDAYDLAPFPDDAPLGIFDTDALPSFAECPCAARVTVGKTVLNAIGHHADCVVGLTTKTAREWVAAEGRGILAVGDL